MEIQSFCLQSLFPHFHIQLFFVTPGHFFAPLKFFRVPLLARTALSPWPSVSQDFFRSQPASVALLFFIHKNAGKSPCFHGLDFQIWEVPDQIPRKFPPPPGLSLDFCVQTSHKLIGSLPVSTRRILFSIFLSYPPPSGGCLERDWSLVFLASVPFHPTCG